jgi:hypothetical protein
LNGGPDQPPPFRCAIVTRAVAAKIRVECISSPAVSF